MRSIFLIVLLLGSVATRAATVTLDFEEQTFNDYTEGPTIISQGFEFGTNLEGNGPSTWANLAGSDSERGQFYCPGCVATMEEAAGRKFSLHSLDLANYSAYTDDRSITLTGYYLSGGAVSTVLTATTDLANWTNYTFGAEWQNLVTLKFGALDAPNDFTAIGFDNLVVTSVPIPAAVWLFGSGLGLLGWFRRRQTA